MPKRLLPACVVIILSTAPAVSGENDTPRRFTLDQAIAYALNRSFQVKSLGLSLESARQTLAARRGAFRTSADLEFNLPSLTQQLLSVEVANGLPAYNTRGTLRFSGALNINQPLPTNGLFTLSAQLYQQDVSTFLANADSELKRRDFLTSVGLRFRQPLFTINTLKLGYEEANLNYERTQGMIKRTELDVIYQVTQAFYELYRAVRELEIAREELKQQQEAYDLARKKFNAGLIPEVEALQAEVDLAQSQNRVFSAETAVQRAADIFKQAIGMPLSEQVTVQADMRYKPVTVDLDRALEYGLAHRSELRELEIEKRLQEINVKRVAARSEFKAEFSAYYDLTGVSDATLPFHTATPELFRSSLEDLRKRPKNRGVVFTVSMPLWDSGVNAAETAAAEAQLDQTRLRLENQRETVIREIKDVVARVQEAQNRLRVLEKSQQVAERSYEISLARFDNGDITTQELALDRDRLTQARMAYLQAFIDYQLALADLKRKTLYDFENDRPVQVQ